MTLFSLYYFEGPDQAGRAFVAEDLQRHLEFLDTLPERTPLIGVARAEPLRDPGQTTAVVPLEAFRAESDPAKELLKGAPHPELAAYLMEVLGLPVLQPYAVSGILQGMDTRRYRLRGAWVWDDWAYPLMVATTERGLWYAHLSRLTADVFSSEQTGAIFHVLGRMADGVHPVEYAPTSLFVPD